MNARCLVLLPLLMTMTLGAQNVPDSPTASPAVNPFLELMSGALAHARAHGAPNPVLSPYEMTVVPGPKTAARMPLVPVAQLQGLGIRVVPWTTNEPERMRALMRTGVDGLISDRPDLLQQVLAEERAAHPEAANLKHFVVSAHRGGRGLRPENTLPSFENGLDLLATELETDTGVSTDGVSLIWHDQFYNPQSCRRADGSAYTLENRVYLRDISSREAQRQFICDKLHFGPTQQNDLALSPVAVAFARQEGLVSPYVPTYVEQLFKFVAFYADYYGSGPGKTTAHAAERAANARTVRFNLETKIMSATMVAAEARLHPEIPAALLENHTQAPEVFVATLGGMIMKHGMEERCEIQSFDFRTLRLVEEQFGRIPTYYLTQDPGDI